MGPIEFPEKSVRNSDYSLRNNSEERSSLSRSLFYFPGICLYYFLAFWEFALSIVIE